MRLGTTRPSAECRERMLRARELLSDPDVRAFGMVVVRGDGSTATIHGGSCEQWSDLVSGTAVLAHRLLRRTDP